jgi:hypothetical protein
MDSLQTIAQETYNAAFCGLRNTRVFTVRNEDAENVIGALNQSGVRNVSYEGGKYTRLSCFTTGIKTDRPFGKDQV